MVLLLSDTLASAPALAFERTFRARIGRTEPVLVLDTAQLRALGFDGRNHRPFARSRFERVLAERIASLLTSSTVDRIRRFPIFVVGLLGDPGARTGAISPLPAIEGALGRVAFPRGLEPLLAGMWVLPGSWDRLGGAGLYAWLKELAAVMDWRASHRLGRSGYAATLVLGRSGAHEEAVLPAPILDDERTAMAGAEWVAACFRSRLLDWTLGLGRKGGDRPEFGAVGVARVERSGLCSGIANLDEAMRQSRVLWPVVPPLAAGSTAAIRQAVAGSIDSVPEMVRARLNGWEAIMPVGAECDDLWMIQFAPGLRATEICGAQEWREAYRSLSSELRRALHGVPEAADWPDPLELPPPAPPPAPQPPPTL